MRSPRLLIMRNSKHREEKKKTMAIHFHSPSSGTAWLPAHERLYGRNLCIKFCACVLGVWNYSFDKHDMSRLKRLLPTDSRMHSITSPERFVHDLTSYLLMAEDEVLIRPQTDQSIRVRPVILNTAIVGGSDPIRLLARLDGQGGLNAYIEGTNRIWLANIIHEGIVTGVLRTGSEDSEEAQKGWLAVEALLRKKDDEPVVTSDSSIASTFPHFHLGASALSAASRLDTTDTELLMERWENMPSYLRWAYALSGLRGHPERELEITPQNWATYQFGHGINAFQLVNLLEETPPEQRRP